MTIQTQMRGHTLLITLDRPEARNAMNRALTVAIGEELDRADADPDVRVVILTGSGEKSFCAGQDLKEAAAGFGAPDPRIERWGWGGYVRHPISKPTIAAVNGFALGGGTELVLASDLAVAADTAAFGLPEVKRGLYAGAGGAFRLPRQIPRKIAMEAMLTGEPISAQRAYELGLVNRVVPPAALLDTAFDLAARISGNAPLAVQASKRLARGIENDGIPGEDDDWRRNTAEGGPLMASDDTAEGLRAFAEKRAPEWRGR